MPRLVWWSIVAICVTAAAGAAYWYRPYLGPPAAIVGQWSGAVAPLPPDAGPYANAASVDLTITRIGQGSSLIGTISIGSASVPLSGAIHGHHAFIVADFSPASVGAPHSRFTAEGTVDGDAIETRTTFVSGGGDTAAGVLIDTTVTLLRGVKPEITPAARVTPFSSLAPQPSFPPDGATYDFYPRTLDLTWSALPSAVRYRVEMQYDGSLNHAFRWTPWWTREIGEHHMRIAFVGAQWGRWRVSAVNARGEESMISNWSTFLFTR